jgi:hypothetical protein
MTFFRILYFFLQMLKPQAGNTAALSIPQDRNVSAIKADVSLVPVDVTVRKKEGGFIDNLPAKDFIVYDNGVFQQIDLFSQKLRCPFRAYFRTMPEPRAQTLGCAAPRFQRWIC